MVWFKEDGSVKEQVKINGGTLSPDAKNDKPTTSVQAGKASQIQDSKYY